MGDNFTRRRVLYVIVSIGLSVVIVGFEFGRDADSDSGGPIPDTETLPDGYGEGPYGSGGFGE